MTYGLTRNTRLSIFVAAAALALSLLAQEAIGETMEEQLARFYLFTNCEPMHLVVESLDSDDKEFGLSKEALQAAAESRLRSARLYTEGGLVDIYLYVNVSVVGAAFHISVELNKYLYDNYSDDSGFSSTWWTGVTGTHGQDPGFILSSLSGQLDRFLVEYLRVNEEACTTR